MEIAASILSADFARLGAEVAATCDAGIRRVHVDVMDGHFVPHLSMGPEVVRGLRPVCERYGARLNAHLMIESPDRFVAMFADAGAHAITVHAEAASSLPAVLAGIRARGLDAGVAIAPRTSEAALEDLLDHVDFVLVMTVEPGRGGQAMIPASLDKVRHLARAVAERSARGARPRVAVDGGVHVDTIGDVVRAGADVAVVGSAIFDGTASVASNVAKLNAAIAEAGAGGART